MTELVYQVFHSRYQFPFYLWWIGSVLKYCKVPKYYEQDCRFNGIFSRNNWPRIKDGAYVINFVDKNSKGTHWILIFINKNTAIYFEVLNKIRDKSITHNIFRIQHNESIMCGFYCVAFLKYMLAGKILLGYTNLFSSDEYKDTYGKRSKSRV